MFEDTLHAGKNKVNTDDCTKFCLAHAYMSQQLITHEYVTQPNISKVLSFIVSRKYNELDVKKIVYFTRFGDSELAFDTLEKAIASLKALKDKSFQSIYGA